VIEQEQEWNNTKEEKEQEMHEQQAQRDLEKVAAEGCALAQSAKILCNINCDVEDEGSEWTAPAADVANMMCVASPKLSTPNAFYKS
jgi:hypothetical protein